MLPGLAAIPWNSGSELKMSRFAGPALPKSDLAPEAMTKLSDIMRYMLYEANTEKVPLSKEADYLKSYIELLQLRLSKPDFIELTISGGTVDKPIVPMLLIPFVENAYKHCNKKSVSPGIRIFLNVDKDLLTFRVINSIKKDMESKEYPEGGIGLKNIKRRLELLYPEKHTLKISEDSDVYSVELCIKLQ